MVYVHHNERVKYYRTEVIHMYQDIVIDKAFYKHR